MTEEEKIQKEQEEQLQKKQQQLQNKLKKNRKQNIIELYKEGLISKDDMSQEQLEQVEDYELKQEQEKQEKLKKKKLFRSRYASFLGSLKNEQEKKQKEEEEKNQKQQQFIEKSKQVFTNVTSKLYQDTQSSKLKDITQEQQASKVRAESCSPDINKEQKAQELKEAQKKLLEKQINYLNKVKEKQQSQKESQNEEEIKKEQLKNKMKQYVLVQVKKDIENGDFYIEDPKELKKLKKKDKEKQKQIENDSESIVSNSQKSTMRYSSAPKKMPSITQNSQQQQENSDDKQEQDDKKKKKKLRSYPFITDYDQWKKKQRLPPDQKIFIVNGGYPAIKKALRERGWLENPDHNSNCFDLKWTLQGRDLDYDNLKDFQIVNHFAKNACLTTKIGICKNLKNLIWFSNIDIDCFFPRCFDLNDPEDYQNFVEDFKTTKAEGILKTYMRMYKQKDKNIDQVLEITRVALNVCQRKIRDLNELIDDPSKNAFQLITDREWEILSKDELNSDSLSVRKHQAWLEKLNSKNKNIKKKKKKKTKKITDLSQKDTEKVQDDELDEDDEDDELQKMDEFTKSVYDLLQNFKENFPQYPLNGENNIWILKPAGLSRGRGIICFNNLIEIEDHVKSKEQQWVIQKYMENPLIIMSRKFDIRVWVLVTDFNPLTIWVYEEVYLRFSAIDYNQEAKELSNKFLHLTNNSVTTKNKGVDKQVGCGNMWSQQEFTDYLIELEGEDIFQNKIFPAIKTGVKNSLECVQDQMDIRKNSCELFGYDFMIDDKYNAMMLECNSSPTMEYSTELTERLVKEQLNDTVKVLVDYNMSKKKKGIDTGKWKRIHKGSAYQEKNVNNLGLNLCLEGTAIKKKTSNLPKIHNIQYNKK